MNGVEVRPRRCRAGDNKNAFPGGFRLWERLDAKGELPLTDGDLPAKDNVAEGLKA